MGTLTLFSGDNAVLPKDFTKQMWGRLLKQPADYWAFVPHALPPDITLDWTLVHALTTAERELARLEGLGHTLSNPHLLIEPFVRREAVLSSRIEGTQASLSELLLFEASNVTENLQSDVGEVRNYVEALEFGLERLRTLPISLRLLNELHQRLMKHARGGHLTPGAFRRSQNWIGPPGCTLTTATYVPPPVHEMMEALGALEKFIHTPSTMPALIKLALIHYQFEAIHPYLDGNGRVGRLLLTLLFCEQRLLHQPFLYLSAFFEKHRDAYYHHLLAVSQKGQWNEWILYFLRGVSEQSQDAVARIQRLLTLQKQYTDQLHSARASTLPLRLVDQLFRRPVTSVPQAAVFLKVTPRTARLVVEKLVALGILTELTGQQRNRLYGAGRIMEILEAD